MSIVAKAKAEFEDKPFQTIGTIVLILGAAATAISGIYYYLNSSPIGIIGWLVFALLFCNVIYFYSTLLRSRNSEAEPVVVHLHLIRIIVYNIGNALIIACFLFAISAGAHDYLEAKRSIQINYYKSQIDRLEQLSLLVDEYIHALGGVPPQPNEGDIDHKPSVNELLVKLGNSDQDIKSLITDIQDDIDRLNAEGLTTRIAQFKIAKLLAYILLLLYGFGFVLASFVLVHSFQKCTQRFADVANKALSTSDISPTPETDNITDV